MPLTELPALLENPADFPLQTTETDILWILILHFCHQINRWITAQKPLEIKFLDIFLVNCEEMNQKVLKTLHEDTL